MRAVVVEVAAGTFGDLLGQAEVQRQPVSEFVELDRHAAGDQERAHVGGEPLAGEDHQAADGPGGDVQDGRGDHLLGRPLRPLELALDAQRAPGLLVRQHDVDAPHGPPDAAGDPHLRARLQPQRQRQLLDLLDQFVTAEDGCGTPGHGYLISNSAILPRPLPLLFTGREASTSMVSKPSLYRYAAEDDFDSPTCTRRRFRSRAASRSRSWSLWVNPSAVYEVKLDVSERGT